MNEVLQVDPLQILKQHFGHDNFLEGQQIVIDKILENQDICVIMPTGAGKSLCYQLPALSRGGYTVVLSPLIALMKDQVEALRVKEIPAVFINSSQTLKEQRNSLNEVMRGSAKPPETICQLTACGGYGYAFCYHRIFQRHNPGFVGPAITEQT